MPITRKLKQLQSIWWVSTYPNGIFPVC